MPLEDSPENNSFAYDTRQGDRRYINIDDADSGKKGYVCIGCGQEMIAYKSKNDRRHYFGHDPKDVERKGQCTFSNETYRHKVAKDILQRIKQIKVPAVFVAPPYGHIGHPQKIRNTEIIQAATVGIEYVFFENEQGEIQYCPNSEWRESLKRRLLIQPDVTFFDVAGKPILLIEVVAAHKLDDEKRFKLKCLGINTVTVNIPKALPDAIEQTFFSIQHTKWSYNHEQATTDYLQVSGQYSATIPSIDELPDEFHEETYRCRTTQINGLIRVIEKCLGEEQYRNVEAYLRGELSRVSANTDRDSQRFHTLQAEHETAIRDEFAERIRQLNEEQVREKTHFQDLGRRYKSKRKELNGHKEQLAQREENYFQRWKDFLERIEREIESLENSISGFRARRWASQATRDSISRETAVVNQQIADTEQQIAQVERETAAIEQRRATLSANYRQATDDLNREFQQKEAGIGPDTEREKIRLDNTFEQDQNRVRSNHIQYREEIFNAVRERNNKRAPRLAGRIADLLQASGLISIIRERERNNRRLQSARKWIKTGAWMDWT